MMIDTTQGAKLDADRQKLFSEGAQRPKLLSANGETDEFQMSGKGGLEENNDNNKLSVNKLSAGIPANDSFQSGSAASGGRHLGQASDIIDSDSELEVMVPET